MNANDIREALKWSLLAAVIVALWCGVLAVRKARATPQDFPQIPGLHRQAREHETKPGTAGMKPVWVIVVFEVQRRKLLGITEFVFTSYEQCREGAEDARRKLGLHIVPVCFLRWMRSQALEGM